MTLGRKPNQVLWLYLSTLVRLLRWRAALALGLAVALGLTQGIGLLMLVPLLRLVGIETGGGRLGAIDRWVSNAFSVIGVRPTLPAVLLVYVGLVGLYGLLQRFQANLSASLHQGFAAALRLQLYRAIARVDWLFFVKSRPAEFLHVLTSETDRVGTATYHLIKFLATAIVGGVYLVLALGLSPALTGLVLLSAGGLGWILRGKLRISRETGKELSQTMRNLYAAIAAHLGGMRAARIYGVEQRYVGAFEQMIRRNYEMVMRAIGNQTGVKHWFELGTVITLSLLLYVSLEVLAMPTAQALLLVFLFSRLMPRFSEMLQSYHHFIHLMPSFSAVIKMQEQCDAAAEPAPPDETPLRFRREIRLEGVGFRYDGVPVIQDLTLTLRFGEIVGLVGPSGIGKSTLADLIMGLITPDEGRILVDGVPLGPETVRSWRNQIGYVGQNTFLFHDTIRANLLFARPSATEEELYQALKLAAADEFVARLPQGLDTVVGEQGLRLSGGERQRIALARALLRKPVLLILDEATSFLDIENERQILENIQRLRGKMTILIISHRASTLRGADVLYDLEHKRVIFPEKGQTAQPLQSVERKERTTAGPTLVPRERETGAET